MASGDKLKIIGATESGETGSVITEKLGMDESVAQLIVLKEEFSKSIGRASSSSSSASRNKTIVQRQNVLLDRVEKVLISWIENKRANGIELTGQDIQIKALSLFENFKSTSNFSENFTASEEWLRKLLSQQNLHNYVVVNEKSVNDQGSVEKFKQYVAAIVEEAGFIPHLIFNIEETILYWKHIPGENSLLERKKYRNGYRPSEDNLTILLGCNSSGTLKLKPFIVYRLKSQSDRKASNEESSVGKPHLNYELFQEWFITYFCPTVESYCQHKGFEFKVLLILNSIWNADSSRSLSSVNENIKVIHLPLNIASNLQPLSIGVFPILKAVYLELVLNKMLCRPYKEMSLKQFWALYTVKEAIKNISTSWDELSPDHLVAAWHELLPDITVKDLKFKISAIVKDVIALGRRVGFENINEEHVIKFINLPLEDKNTFESEVEKIIREDELLEKIKIEKEDEVEIIDIIDNEDSVIDNQDCVMDIQDSLLENHYSIVDNEENTLDNQYSIVDNEDSTLDNQLSIVDNEEALLDNQSNIVDYKESMLDKQINIVENEESILDNQHCVVGNNKSAVVLGLEKIFECIDSVCETIAKKDTNIERSIKVRQMLQNSIFDYRNLYLEETKPMT